MNERERLEKIMDEEGLSAKQFAREVGIQAGTISNILSGRNNPSLDVMKRILNRFRTISSDWLILGVGSMYRQNGAGPDTALFDIKPEIPEIIEQPNPSKSVDTTFVPQTPVTDYVPKSVDKVVIFYSDGTYEER